MYNCSGIIHLHLIHGHALLAGSANLSTIACHINHYLVPHGTDWPKGQTGSMDISLSKQGSPDSKSLVQQEWCIPVMAGLIKTASAALLVASVPE